MMTLYWCMQRRQESHDGANITRFCLKFVFQSVRRINASFQRTMWSVWKILLHLIQKFHQFNFIFALFRSKRLHFWRPISILCVGWDPSLMAACKADLSRTWQKLENYNWTKTINGAVWSDTVGVVSQEKSCSKIEIQKNETHGGQNKDALIQAAEYKCLFFYFFKFDRPASVMCPSLSPYLICWDLITLFVVASCHVERIMTLMWRY